MNGQSEKLNAPILSHVGHKNIILHFCFLVVYLNFFSSFFFTCFITIILYFSNEYWFLTRFPYQMLCAIWQVSLVEQELLTLHYQMHMKLLPILVGIMWSIFSFACQNTTHQIFYFFFNKMVFFHFWTFTSFMAIIINLNSNFYTFYVKTKRKNIPYLPMSNIHWSCLNNN